MYTSSQLACKYLRYYFTAMNGKGHGMHSPFVFDFIQNVLNNKKQYSYNKAIEELRSELKDNHSVLRIEDMGAGSRKGSFKERSVSALAKAALKPPKYAQLMHRLVSHYGPQSIIELGTSLGLTTAYMATANAGARITTIEGSESVAELASSHFAKLQLQNITLHRGNFDEVLPKVLEQVETIDMAYIDGNHRYGPTIEYFRQLLRKTNTNTILVFDDIHWSAEMERAWEEIRNHPEVQYTIDVFFLGFVFFRKEFKVKQHFTIRF